MRYTIEPTSYVSDLNSFSDRNNSRPTRLEVLGPNRDPASDYWLEDGLLFSGIDLEPDAISGPYVEIMLRSSAKHHMTHSIPAVKRIELETDKGVDESLEIEDATGTVTIMRFEE